MGFYGLFYQIHEPGDKVDASAPFFPTLIRLVVIWALSHFI